MYLTIFLLLLLFLNLAHALNLALARNLKENGHEQEYEKEQEKMYQVMSAHGLDTQDEKSSQELIFELREQAEDVRAELKSTQKNSAKYWKATYGVLGLGLSAYGVATDQVIAGVGGLLPMLNLLIEHKTGHESNRDSVISKPGFVLLKAEDILSHAHE